MLQLSIATASAFAIGLGTVLLLWPGAASPKDVSVKIFLGIGFGQGITACLAFVFLLVHGRPDGGYPFYELFVLLVLIALLVRRRRSSGLSPMAHTGAGTPIQSSRYEWILAVALCFAVTVALAAVLIWMYRVPYGHWDAWAIYNLRARSIYRGGSEWRDAFSEFLYRSHPDYPPLLPFAVVRAWMYTGNETMLAPRLIGGLFTAATVGIVPSTIALLRGRSQAYVAGIVLLGNVFLIAHASSQYADVPLMFFYTAAVTLLVLSDEVTADRRGGVLALAGLATGLAVWSKNEGLMFLAVIFVAHCAVVLRTTGWREYSRQLRLLASGLLPVLLIFLYFKLVLAPPGDLATMAGRQPLVAKLIDPDRYLLIAKEVARLALPNERYGIGFALALVLWALCAGLGAMRTRAVAFGALTWLLLFAGYVAVYVVTPYPLAWHLSTSIDRVLLQLWPMFVFVYFLIVATPDEIFGSRVQPYRSSARAGEAD